MVSVEKNIDLTFFYVDLNIFEYALEKCSYTGLEKNKILTSEDTGTPFTAKTKMK